MQQRVRRPHRGKILRPPGKLPVPVALNAGSPTLFHTILHNNREKVKGNFSKWGVFPITSQGLT